MAPGLSGGSCWLSALSKLLCSSARSMPWDYRQSLGDSPKEPLCETSGYTSACGWDKGDCEAGPEEGPEGRRKRGRKHKPLRPLDRCADGCLPADIHDSTCDEACNVCKSCQVRGPSSRTCTVLAM